MFPGRNFIKTYASEWAAGLTGIFSGAQAEIQDASTATFNRSTTSLRAKVEPELRCAQNARLEWACNSQFKTSRLKCMFTDLLIVQNDEITIS
jgi:hypothetical protein